MMLTALLPWIEGFRRQLFMVALGVDDVTLWIFFHGVQKRGSAAWLVSHGLFITGLLADCMTE